MGQDETERAYVIDRSAILVCCWFEARYGGRRFKRHWKAWLGAYEGTMWAGKWEDVPLPPLIPEPVPRG